MSDIKKIASDERISEIVEQSLELGDDEVCKIYGITPATLIRYKRYYSNSLDKDFKIKASLKKISETYTEKELLAIAKGGRIIPGVDHVPIVDFSGDCVTFGALTDLHIGSVFFNPEYLQQAFEEFEREGVDFVTISGDVTDGMSRRRGQIYELSEIGYDRQRDRAIELLGQTSLKLYIISGNHDYWYIDNTGADVVKAICNELKNAEYLGIEEGDISLNGDVTIKLWHGEDGSSYALSYRLQKIIEAFTGGEKPSIMICGHTHKYVKIFLRNIWAVSVGSIQTQTRWMRQKRMASHTGFVICRAWIKDRSVVKFSDTFYPFYA